MHRLLFVCIRNAGRSQMAEAFANALGKGQVVARSAGTDPGASLDPQVVAVMKEVGLDLGQRQPQPLTPELVAWADRIISMGCQVAEACPASVVPTEDWALDDPQGRPLAEVRRIRDEVRAGVLGLLAELGVAGETMAQPTVEASRSVASTGRTGN